MFSTERSTISPFSKSSQLDKVIPQTFGYVLRLYPRHPESKS